MWHDARFKYACSFPVESRCYETLWSRVYLTSRRRSLLSVTATSSHCERNKLGIFRMFILSSRRGSCACRGWVLLNNMSLLMLRNKNISSLLISGTVTITGEDKWKSNHSCFIVAEEVQHVTTEQSDNNQMDVGDACGTSTSRQEHVSSGLLKCHEVSSLVAVCGQTLALVLTLYFAWYLPANSNNTTNKKPSHRDNKMKRNFVSPDRDTTVCSVHMHLHVFFRVLQ